MTESPPFIVFAMPRSRSYWTSRFLTYGEWICGHDELRHCGTMADVAAWFTQPCIGTVETAAAPFWRLATRTIRAPRVVTLRRPVDQVVESHRSAGWPQSEDLLARIARMCERKLDQIEARVPGVLRVTFDDLRHEDACAAMFEHCLPYRHDHAHWAELAPRDLQIDVRAFRRHDAAYAWRTRKLHDQARQMEFAAMCARPPPIGELTFAIVPKEDGEQFIDQARHLFRGHMTATGQNPTDWQGKNLPLLKLMLRSGALQIATASCNGRLVGYQMTMLSPSLDDPSIRIAQHIPFFADPAFPGVGLKIMRYANERLREMGISVVYGKAGIRGAGPRIGTLWKRLGGKPAGEFFEIDFREVA